MNDRHKDIATPTRTRAILEAHGFSFKKSLGQNFIIDANILRQMTRAAELDKETGVIEVGPGIGALTEQLSKQAGRVLAVELDQRLLPILEENVAVEPHVTVIHGDVLRMDLRSLAEKYFKPDQPLCVVANLPYYVTTPIIMHLLTTALSFRHIVVMIQKEVAARLTADPGSKDYGSLSIAVQYHAFTSRVMDVPKTVFIPQPNVASTVVRLTRRKQPAVSVQDEAFFFYIVRTAFRQRRKTLLNNLRTLVPKQQFDLLVAALRGAQLDASRRAETLSISEFARLSDALRPLVPNFTS